MTGPNRINKTPIFTWLPEGDHTYTHIHTQHNAVLEVGRELTPDWGREGSGVGKEVRVIELRDKVKRRVWEPETENLIQETIGRE